MRRKVLPLSYTYDDRIPKDTYGILSYVYILQILSTAKAAFGTAE